MSKPAGRRFRFALHEMIDTKNLKVAIVHEWLAGMRGAERCLECMCELFPTADIYTLFHVKGSVSDRIESHSIRTSYLHSLPYVETYYRYLLPLMPFAVESFDFKGYDLVISGSSCVAHGAVVPPGVPHLSYVFSPMRYAWDLSHLYFSGERGGERAGFAIASSLLHPIRMWDAASWMRPDVLISVSEYVSKRLNKVSGRESAVVYPPVDTQFFSSGLREEKRNYYLMVTAFEPNRRPEVGIDACSQAGIPLKVVGSLGRYGKRCRERAGKSVDFMGAVDDVTLRTLMGGAQALIVPGIEDFGMAAVEAMATGTPVIVSSEGGVRESLVGEKDSLGVVFDGKEELLKAINAVRAGWSENRWDRKAISNHAGNFSKEVFRQRFMNVVEESLNRSRSGGIHDTIRSDEC